MTNLEAGADKVEVLFIVGRGRSGSTLLDLMLGQIEGFFSIGELRYIWERGLEWNELCGCGRPFNECRFWSSVLEEAFEQHKKIDVSRMKDLQWAVDRILYIPKMLHLWRDTEYQDNLAEYTQVLGRLYRAIGKISQSHVIVDSSKIPSYGFILSAMPGIEMHVVHLVRDSRAVAYSWQRRKIRPGVHWKREYMPQHSLLHSSWGWNLWNVLGHLLGYVNGRYTLVRYEDLVNCPQETLSRILASDRPMGIVPLRESITSIRASLSISLAFRAELYMPDSFEEQVTVSTS